VTDDRHRANDGDLRASAGVRALGVRLLAAACGWTTGPWRLSRPWRRGGMDRLGDAIGARAGRVGAISSRAAFCARPDHASVGSDCFVLDERLAGARGN